MAFNILLVFLCVTSIIYETLTAKVSPSEDILENEDKMEIPVNNADDHVIEDQTNQHKKKISESTAPSRSKQVSLSSQENIRSKLSTSSEKFNDEDEPYTISYKKHNKTSKSKLTSSKGHPKIITSRVDGKYRASTPTTSEDIPTQLSNEKNPYLDEEANTKLDITTNKAQIRSTFKPRYEDRFTVKMTPVHRPTFTKLSEAHDITALPNSSFQSQENESIFKKPSHSSFATKMTKMLPNSKTITEKYGLSERKREPNFSLSSDVKQVTKNKYTTLKPTSKDIAESEDDAYDNRAVTYRVKKSNIKIIENFTPTTLLNIISKNTIPDYKYEESTEANHPKGKHIFDDFNLKTGSKRNLYSIDAEISDKIKRDESFVRQPQYPKNYPDQNELDLLLINNQFKDDYEIKHDDFQNNQEINSQINLTPQSDDYSDDHFIDKERVNNADNYQIDDIPDFIQKHGQSIHYISDIPEEIKIARNNPKSSSIYITHPETFNYDDFQAVNPNDNSYEHRALHFNYH